MPSPDKPLPEPRGIKTPSVKTVTVPPVPVPKELTGRALQDHQDQIAIQAANIGADGSIKAANIGANATLKAAIWGVIALAIITSFQQWLEFKRIKQLRQDSEDARQRDLELMQRPIMLDILSELAILRNLYELKPTQYIEASNFIKRQVTLSDLTKQITARRYLITANQIRHTPLQDAEIVEKFEKAVMSDISQEVSNEEFNRYRNGQKIT